MPKTDAVNALVKFIKEKKICFEILPESDQLKRIFWREISITIETQTFTLPVFDEFKDTELNNAAVWFHLILQSCEYYEDSSDYPTWLADNGLSNTDISHEIYTYLSSVVPQIRIHIGHEPKAINDRDIEFNTHIAQDLRAFDNALHLNY